MSLNYDELTDRTIVVWKYRNYQHWENSGEKT